MRNEDAFGLRPLLSNVLLLGAAALAVFTTGTQQGWSMSIFYAVAGVAALVGAPEGRLRALPIALGALFCLTTLLVLLPVGWFSVPEWRSSFPANSLYTPGTLVAAVPALSLWWSSVLLGTFLAAIILFTQPLQGRNLAIFMHLVAAVVAAYAVVSIVAWQTDWSWPFAEGDVFGLLPNRNHTATLLVVGAIISFGLMQWELTHGYKVGATLAALCGAPALAALLFFSISRAGVLLLAAGFVIWAFGAVRSAGNRKAVVVSCLVLAAFLGGLFVLGGSTVRDRLAEFSRQALATEAEAEDGEAIDFRQPIYKDTWRMIGDAPLTGVGLGHFAQVFPHYRQASLRAVGVLHPESDWLMVVAENGWPAVLLLAVLAIWFLTVCWRSRTRGDGLLRWTIASAIAAALLHAFIDVPWRRPASGWFLMVVALAAVPPLASELRRPFVVRGLQVIIGILLLAGGAYLGWQTTTDRPPVGYRLAAYDAELEALGEAGLHDDGEFVAREAIRDFPLHPRAYLWHMGFLRMFLGTEEEMAEAAMLASYVDPVQPSIPAGAATAWIGIDGAAQAAASVEAVRRAARIDEVQRRGGLPSAGRQVELALRRAAEEPEVQLAVGRQLAGEPLLLAYWLQYAPPPVVEAMVAELADPAVVLRAAPTGLRRTLLGRWITMPEPLRGTAVAYMESQAGEEPGPYWRALARFYAESGDAPRAVRLVATAAGLDLADVRTSREGFAGQLNSLEAQGNVIAVQRLLREVSQAKKADAEQLAAVMAWAAAEEDWENAWQAAFRLASDQSIGND